MFWEKLPFVLCYLLLCWFVPTVIMRIGIRHVSPPESEMFGFPIRTLYTYYEKQLHMTTSLRSF